MNIKRFFNKFLWEKSVLNNKGIFFKFSLSKYCYIKPTSGNTWDNVYRRDYFNTPYDSYYICTEKVFYWLWFRLSLRVESEFLSTIDEGPTTEDLFNMIPPFLNIDGDVYHFNMVKGDIGPMIAYEKNDKMLADNVRDPETIINYGSGKDLKDVCIKTIKWLKDFGYIEYMPEGYKEKYDKFEFII